MPEGGNWQQLIPALVFMVIVLALFWWVVVRPTQVRQRKHQDLVGTLKPGDLIITVGGIHGKVTTVQEKTLGLEIARGISIRIDRRAVRRRQEQEDF